MTPLRPPPDYRVDLARHLARFAAVAFWILSAFSPAAGVPATWLVPLLALAVAALAIPTRTPLASRPEAWTAAVLSVSLAVVSGIRAESSGELSDPVLAAVIVLCVETMVVLVPLWVGQRIDDALGPRLANGRGRMRVVSIAAIACGVVWVGVTLSRFPDRVEATRLRAPRASQPSQIGVYQPFGARCPPRCDQGPDGRPRNANMAMQNARTDEIVEGATLQRERVGAMNTRVRLLYAPRGHAPRYVFDRVIPGGQEIRVGRDPSGAHLTLDYGQHPRTLVRLDDGAVFTQNQPKNEHETPFHAPVAYVLGALAGLGAALWFLSRAAIDRRALGQRSEWRRATIESDGMVHFNSELPPAPLPEGVDPTPSDAVVMRVTAPLGTGYRSDGVVTIHEMFLGSTEQLGMHLAARATAWEHGAFACVLATQAPLIGVCLFGETW